MKAKKVLLAILTSVMIFGISTTAFANNRVYTRDDYPTTWTFSNTGQTVETYFNERGDFVAMMPNGIEARLVGRNLIHLPNAYNGGNNSSATQNQPAPAEAVSPVSNDAVEVVTAEQPRAELPVPFTNEELQTLIVEAPAPNNTRSATVFTNNRLTDVQLNAWVDEYYNLGGINAFELEVVRLINIERANEGLAPLAISEPLMMAARFKSQEMVDLNYFGHSSPVYNTFAGGSSSNIPALFGHENERFKLSGQGSLQGSGENLGSGQISAERVVQSWMSSVGHRQAMMDTDAKTIGVGRVRAITTANFGY